MTTLNLVRDAWITVTTQRGISRRIAPWQVTDGHDGDDAIVAVDSNRSDFRSSIQQFLIGLLQTTMPPSRRDETAWGSLLMEAPRPEVLRAACAPYEKAFDLTADGPCFMQDFDPLADGTVTDVAALLIDSPGAQSIGNNADFFVKRGRIAGLCPACVATALHTLQTNAPAGGSGVRTSLRGGGPLTTLVVPDPRHTGEAVTLWRALWLNVLDHEEIGGPPVRADASVFPWLGPTRTSEAKGGVETTPADVHPLQCYWGMPRRIRIDWDEIRTGTCDVCGAGSEQLVSRFRSRPRGTNYTGPWRHPLSPYYQQGPEAPFLPLHPRPGGIGYQHWLTLVAECPGASSPAQVVAKFLERVAHAPGIQPRLHACGYDMDKMKPRNWYETTMPLVIANEAVRPRFEQEIAALVQAASAAAKKLQLCTRDAWADDPPRTDLHHLDAAFYDATQSTFFELLHALRARLEADEEIDDGLRRWHRELCNAATGLFAHWAAPEGFEYGNPRRVARARQSLMRFLHTQLKAQLRIDEPATEDTP